MSSRSVAGITLLLLTMLAGSPTRAQQPQSAGTATPPSGWTVNVAPYLWLPTISTTASYNLPPALGGRVEAESSTGPGEWLTHLNFAAAFSADARYGRFNLLTDFQYSNFSFTDSHFRSIDFTGHPSIPISRALQTSVGARMESTIWTLAGGYTVLEGNWGNLDLFAGFRLMATTLRTNYSLALTITGPRGNGATFGGIGSISGQQNVWNGIGGFRGRIRLGNPRVFIPYYFDIGAGGSQLTWQIASGLGYQFNWGAVSATYRYLSFEQGDDAVIRHIGYHGPMLMATFSF